MRFSKELAVIKSAVLYPAVCTSLNLNSSRARTKECPWLVVCSSVQHMPELSKSAMKGARDAASFFCGPERLRLTLQ